MKIKITPFPALSLAATVLLVTFNIQFSTLCAQGTAFTYQGRLNAGANAANGIYDLRFTIPPTILAASSPDHSPTPPPP